MLVWVFAALCAVVCSVQPLEFQGQVWHVTTKSSSDYSRLVQLLQNSAEFDVWHASRLQQTIDVRVPSNFDASSWSKELSEGVEVEVVEKDMMQLAQRSWNWTCSNVDECVGDDFYTRYQSLEVVYARMDNNIRDSQGMMRAINLGFSFEQRPIRGFTLTANTDNTNKRHALYHCAIHAREWITVPTCMWLGETLFQRYHAGDRFAITVLENFILHIVPVLNVDGYAFTFSSNNMWRKTRKPNPSNPNCVGTDLNRQFPVQWGRGGSSDNPCSDTYMGVHPLDQPEAIALNNYVGALNNFAVYLDIHAWGDMWMTPYAYPLASTVCPSGPRNCGVEDEEDYQHQMACGQASSDAIFATHGRRFAVGPVAWVIYQASGNAVDQMYYGHRIRYAYTNELRVGFQPDPLLHIIPSNEEQYNGIMAQLDYVLRH